MILDTGFKGTGILRGAERVSNDTVKLKTKILIADDEESIRRLVLATLKYSDHEILLAKDGEEALEIILREHPDMLILDIGMPKIDGLEVCRRSKADPKISKMRIILLTGNATDTARAQGLQARADAYLVKPFSPTALLREIDKMLATAE